MSDQKKNTAIREAIYAKINEVVDGERTKEGLVFEVDGELVSVKVTVKKEGYDLAEAVNQYQASKEAAEQREHERAAKAEEKARKAAEKEAKKAEKTPE